MVSENGRITRVAIFVDHDNFTITYAGRAGDCRSSGPIQKLKPSFWAALSDRMIMNYKDIFLCSQNVCIQHMGTYVCVGLPRFYSDETKEIAGYFDKLDRQNGFIVKYGTRAGNPGGGEDCEGKLGKEKGVDTEIVCQKLMGAFQDHYDVAILMSDDADYLPAVDRVQAFFGKRVIHAGYQAKLLRARCYGHIPLERADKELRITAQENHDEPERDGISESSGSSR